MMSRTSSSKTAKVIENIYAFITWIISISGLVWCLIILAGILDKGRLPIETDARFIKGIFFEIGLFAFLGMIYGGIIWIIITGIVLLTKKIKSNAKYLKLGSLALIVNIALFYLIFFSETGKWILD